MAPVNKRVLVGYGIDCDAVSSWINSGDGKPASIVNVSRGIFGATVGIPRLLKMFDKFEIKATWFCPAHTAESFPRAMIAIRDAGHEIGLHGYTHEVLTTLSMEQQKAVLAKSIDVLTEICGKPPSGYTAPCWVVSKEMLPMLEEFGIVYDHSLMHHDFQPYYAPFESSWTETNYEVMKEADEWMKPMAKIEKHSDIVEIPANWHLDDWPALQYTSGKRANGFVDPHMLSKFWCDQFDMAYREYDTFIFPMSIHPQVSGELQNILMHERIIEYINKHEGVEWCTFEQIAEEFKAGRIEGHVVET